MKYREQIKSIEEYTQELKAVASPEIVEKYQQYIKEGRKVTAIKKLREYNIITEVVGKL